MIADEDKLMLGALFISAGTGVYNFGNRLPDDIILDIYELYNVAIVNIEDTSGVFDVSTLEKDYEAVKNLVLTSSTVTTLCGSIMHFEGNLVIKDMPKLEKISYGFMSWSYLKSCRIENTPMLYGIKGAFLNNCPNLLFVEFDNVNGLTWLDDFFICSCISLIYVDFGESKLINEIGDFFMTDNIALIDVKNLDVSNVFVIKDYFLSCCRKLKKIKMESFNNVVSIGVNFMAGCNVDFRLLVSLPSSKYTFHDTYNKLEK